MNTDVDFVRSVLMQGPATTNEILSKSFQERGCGLTVHSRVADLRTRLEAEGLGTVECRRVGSRNGRGVFEYSLTQLRLFDVAFTDREAS